MSNSLKNVFLLAGEASGDARGAELARALLARDPALKISGMGGAQMRKAGAEILADVTEQAVVGIFEAARRYPYFKSIFDRLLEECAARRPAAVVGIDFPGFNLRFEKAARRVLGAQTLIAHYISPQLWAWHESRKHSMARFLDLVLCIFPFEPAVYEGTGLRAQYVGHPLALSIQPADAGSRDPHLIALLPGSRRREIEYHWPVFEETVRRLKKLKPELKFAVGSNEGRKFPGFETRDAPWLMRHAGAGAVASGTATLEACLYGMPMVAVYKVFAPTYWLGKLLVTIPHLAMPNVIAGREIIPELIQGRCSPELLSLSLRELLDSPERRKLMLEDYAAVRKALGQANAAENAAQLILESLRPRAGAAQLDFL